MDMQGSERIEAPVETVWQALNDPEILRQSIPGCESLEKTSDTHMTAKVVLKIGPIKARFEGAVELQNLNPPHSYTIAGEGKGGLAGFAKGGAGVTLASEEDGATLLTYTVRAEVGGKIAQLGSRLIESTSKKLAGEFFSNFSAAVTAGDVKAEA
jgi:carbon monoxide dehydrogenase subunit G